MNTQSYKINNFNITLSPIDNVIYIKVVDDISFQTYENNIDFDDIKLPFDKNDILNIICDCFSLKENCTVSFLIKHNCMKLTFDILFNLKYKYNFDIVLNEKKINTELKYNKEIYDLQLKYENTISTLENNNKNFERLISDREYKMKELLRIINILECENNNYEGLMLEKENKITELLQTINILECKNNISTQEKKNNKFKTFMSEKENLDIEEYIFSGDKYDLPIKINLIKNFYKLNKLIIAYNYEYLVSSNETVKILIIRSPNIKTLEGLNTQFPSLEVIVIESSGIRDPIDIIPYLHKNIKKIELLGPNITFILSTKNKHIQFTQYCKINGIELIC